MPALSLAEGVALAVWGLLWGSFLNVVIVRLPHGKDCVRLRSHCPKCQQKLRWYDNVPLFSFLFLRGKCRSCAGAISWQYPIIEFLTAVMTVVVVWRWGWTVRALEAWSLSLLLLPLVKIDLDLRLLPDKLTYPGMVLGLLFSISGYGLVGWLESVLGLVLGFGFFFLIAWIYYHWKKREGLGGGDIKLLGMIGAFLGVQSLPAVLLISSLTGSLVGIVQMIVKREGWTSAVPFGPFLALGAWIYLFWGEQLLTWYLGA